MMTCKACGRPDKFDFNVPEDIWATVVPEKFRNRVVCLFCFDEYAREVGVEYAEHIVSLYFAGRRACFEFRVVTGVSVND